MKIYGPLETGAVRWGSSCDTRSLFLSCCLIDVDATQIENENVDREAEFSVHLIPIL